MLPHRKKRQCDARKLNIIVVWLRIPRECFILAGEPDHEPDNGRRQKRHFEDALTAPFDLSRDHRMATGDQAATSGFNADAVIAHEPCKKAGAFGGRDQGERQAAFAGAGWPANEHTSFSDHDDACMEVELFRIRGRSVPFREQGLSCLWQKYQEAGAEHRGQAISAGGADPVERRYASAMGLDDLARDGKPKARVLPEALIRAVGIKSFEYPFESIGRNAGAVVVDNNLETVARVALGRVVYGCTQQHANASVSGRKRSRIVDEIIENLTEARIVPENRESPPAAILQGPTGSDDEFDTDRAGIPDQVGHCGNRNEQALQIDENHVVARHFGIEFWMRQICR